MKHIFLTAVEVDITPAKCADIFATMDGDEQAEFFNALAEHIKEWQNPFCFQLQSVIDSGKLTAEAKQVMFEIGNYSK